MGLAADLPRHLDVARGAPPVLAWVEEALRSRGVDLARLGLAWARAAPTVALVPAFGLRALPAPVRAIVGLVLALVIFPAIPATFGSTASVWTGMLQQAAAGVPVALAAAIPLWAATMAGGVVDSLRGTQDAQSAPTVEGRATVLGVAFSMVACSLFFASGGPALLAQALATPAPDSAPVLHAAESITRGITVAVAIGGPLLSASIVVEVAGALVARAATPAQIHLLLAPLRSLGLLAVTALVFPRMVEVLASVVAQRGP